MTLVRRLGAGSSVQPDHSTHRYVRRRQILWLLPSLPLSALAVLTRGYPTTGSDTGIFLSVAGRLLAGDKLYRDVFDNKDPLLYFSQSFALWVGGWRGPFLMDVAWLIVASVSTHLLLHLVTGDLVMAVFGQLLYPLLLTGFHYYAADSETPALSLLPLFAYLVYRGRPRVAGLVAAATLLLRLNLLPVVAAVAVGRFLFARTSRPGRELLVLLSSTAAGVGVIFLILAWRGEGHAYVRTLWQNVDYSSRLLRFHDLPSGVHGHLLVVWQKMPTAGWLQLGALFVTVAGAVFLSADAPVRVRSQLVVITAAIFSGTMIALATTALWDHHLQLLAFPIVCGATLTLKCMRILLSPRVGQVVSVGAVGCFFVATSLLMTPPSIWKLRQWGASPDTAVSDGLHAAAEQEKQPRTPLSYFHLGENDETGSGAFLDGSFRLSCPRFHQYPFLAPEQLRQTMRCVERTRPHLIAVTPSFTYHRSGGRFGAWNDFVLAGREYLRSHCEQVVATVDVRVYRCRAIR